MKKTEKKIIWSARYCDNSYIIELSGNFEFEVFAAAVFRELSLS